MKLELKDDCRNGDSLKYLLDNYIVTKKGIVVNKEHGNLISISRTNSGRKYIAIMDGNKKLYKYDLAILLAKLYLKNPNNENYIEFKDGDITNCSLNNLKWVSYDDRTFTHKKPVVMMDKDSNIIKEFDSLKNAANYVKGSPVAISDCCKGKTMTSYGYTWKFKYN